MTGKHKKLNHHAAERERSESTSGSEDGSIDEKYLSQEENQTIPEEGGERLAVYIARYSYDPYQHSPNENPEAELAFQAGEYLYVFGEMDEVRYQGWGIYVRVWRDGRGTVSGLGNICTCLEKWTRCGIKAGEYLYLFGEMDEVRYQGWGIYVRVWRNGRGTVSGLGNICTCLERWTRYGIRAGEYLYVFGEMDEVRYQGWGISVRVWRGGRGTLSWLDCTGCPIGTFLRRRKGQFLVITIG